MNIYFDAAQLSHDPKSFLVAGAPKPCPEVPERARILSQAVAEQGHQILKPEPCGIGPAARIHTPEYLDFLRVVYDKWQTLPGASDVVIPNIHPRGRAGRYPASIVGRAGYHMMDTACPIGAGTYEAVLASLSSAIAAVDQVLGEGGSEAGGAAYALCRPPGHHAYADASGGFCFVNNSAAAAQRLRDRLGPVVILDVDVHHGNGTQGIFYAREDVMTVSIHCDPVAFYPFFEGHADERGEGPGLGYNLNLPLPKKSGDDVFLSALDTALDRIAFFQPSALVVALGLDAYEGDPFAGLSVTTTGFERIGRALGAFHQSQSLPTVLVQEGGYPSPELGENLCAVLRGFEAA